MQLVPEKNSLARWLVLPFVLTAGAVLAAARLWPDLLLGLAHCPWRDITGLACLTCGGTHAAVALAQGRWSEAWLANPLAPLLAVAVLAWSLWSLAATAVPALRVRLALSPGERKAARIGTALLLGLVWLRQILVA